jgi:hypothetical protein
MRDTLLVTADVETARCRAAAVKLPNSATLAKASMSLNLLT